jgi:septum formation protein
VRLVLASQSPRRRELLERAGFCFEVRVSGVPEEVRAGESPLDYVLRLSRAKAEAVPMNNGEIVLGADTVVVLDEHILEKPVDAADAERMIRLLRGREHSVITGICLRSHRRTLQDAAETVVRFTELTDDEIHTYVASGEPMDKAGGYGIQGRASKFIERIDGCYFNVVGLPVSLICRRLQEL